MVRFSTFAALAAMAGFVAAELKPTPSIQHLVQRQQRAGSSATAAAAGGSSAAAAGASPGLANYTAVGSTSLPASVLSIVATIAPGTASVFPTYTLPTSATPGQTQTYVSGAPAIPTSTPVLANYPTPDVVPPTDSPTVQQWMSKIDFSKVPNIPQNPTEISCANSSNPNVGAAAQNGWWTCGGHTRDTDVTTCKDQNTWGVSYDDGPSPYTPLLLDYFQQNNIKSTFFVVGSRVIYRPQMLQAEYVSGHQLSVHTWSHTALTTQSNAQIVAELAWTMKVINETIGVTPNTMRPPYGDIDDRVRAIALQMGLTPIIWTSANGKDYDTNDWKIGAGVVSAANSAALFENIIKQAPSLNTGYIVLSHDLYQQSVDLSTKVILPFVQQFTPKQNLVPIFKCLGQTQNQAYIETAGTSKPSTGGSSSGGGSTGGSSSSTTGGKSPADMARPAHAAVLGALAGLGGALAIF